MRVLIQRVNNARVDVAAATVGKISTGLLVFVGIEDSDTAEDIEWLCNKIVNLRVFDDAANIPNLSVKEVSGDILVVSQFTLHASTKKGNRPSYLKASKPEIAIPIYEKFIHQLETILEKPVAKGKFGADMQVSLVNDGPITIWIDSKARD